MSVDKTLGYSELKLESGQTIPLKFGWGALEVFAELNNLALEDVFTFLSTKYKQRPIKTATQILLSGAICYEEIEQTGQDFTYKQAAGWVDELGMGSAQVTKAINKFFAAITIPTELVEEQSEKEGPKKKED